MKYVLRDTVKTKAANSPVWFWRMQRYGPEHTLDPQIAYRFDHPAEAVRHPAYINTLHNYVVEEEP